MFRRGEPGTKKRTGRGNTPLPVPLKISGTHTAYNIKELFNSLSIYKREKIKEICFQY